MTNSLKLNKRETQEQSIESFVVRIMELNLNWSDLITCSIKHSVETNILDAVPNTLKISRHADLLIWVVRPIEERWLANTMFHVTFMDFISIKVRKSLTGFDTS
jgi:hypothetical protein